LSTGNVSFQWLKSKFTPGGWLGSTAWDKLATAQSIATTTNRQASLCLAFMDASILSS
jgi:hypothetical protein